MLKQNSNIDCVGEFYFNVQFCFVFFQLDKLSLEGIVVQRAECRPAASENYMKLKR